MHTMLEDYGVEINEYLIDELREAVNHNLDYVYTHFSDQKGKNRWGALCSCMDWITVAIRYIKNYPELSDDIDIRAMQVYSLISSIDIITESIEQLHRIVISEKLEGWPFKGKNTVFKKKVAYLSGKDDDLYFGEIRSVFGAHPTKLRNGKEEKLFASWPHENSFEGFDFTVNLSSNIVGKEDVSFGINIAELLAYAKERFEHLGDIKHGLDFLYDKRCNELAKIQIPESHSIQEELDLLLEASKVRFNNEYYHYTISELITIFSVTLTEEKLKSDELAFKDKLLPLIVEIRRNLQNMKLVDLECGNGVIVSSLPGRALSYELPKLFSLLHSERYDPLIDYYFKQLNKYCDEKYTFRITDGYGITLLKIRMMTYAESKR
ncbi:TPA: hypothetical protein ACV5CR_001341 [Klebsiella aerogenes]|uniref:hypothetical protein n=1 Tax=Klebsiella aerogenes TaxID=548 RepID=UPI002E6EA9F0|nr:hypothetical protein [Klebsiella aerogenes]HBR6987110.1 hypothetical protein [Klebsiella aerogenes]